MCFQVVSFQWVMCLPYDIRGANGRQGWGANDRVVWCKKTLEAPPAINVAVSPTHSPFKG